MTFEEVQGLYFELVIMMKENEKWMKDLIDAVMKWLDVSTKAAESQIKYNGEWSLSKETEVEMEDREDWSNKFQDEWE